MTTASGTRHLRLPWHRRLVPVLATLLLLVSGFAVPAQAAPRRADYWLTPAYPGDELHLPVMMYRHRHTVLADEVSWDRNVAAFEFYTPAGVRLIIVGPSLPSPNFKNAAKTTPLDVYREIKGHLALVDGNGDPLEENGRPVDWRNSATPSVRWEPGADQNAEIQEAVRIGRHSEWVTSLYLKHHLGQANLTSKEGLSERIPCESVGNNCKVNLKTETGGLYPNLENMRFITDKLGSREGRAQAKKDLETIQREWERLGMPTNANAEALLGWRLLVTPGSPPPQGAATNALAPQSDLGGIDFSTLELRYLREGSGGKLQYAFNAASVDGLKPDTTGGRVAAAQASDAFFVWLSMPESTFWVNLNPNEPNRIIDDRLGTTDVGRVLLEADFRMKKVVGRLIHPDTKLGKQFWGTLSQAGNCIDMRQWIVPAPATVYEQDGGLHIVDAPLEVKMETEYFKKQGQPTSCINPDTAMAQRFRTLVLPRLEETINRGPEFAELRRVYLSRVAAGWYRERHRQGGSLSNMIDSGDVTIWPSMREWSPRQVFDQYVQAYQKKEFNVTRRVPRGNMIYEETYTYGGVDFSKVELNRTPTGLFQKDHADLPAAVQRSVQQPAADGHGRVWLGAVGEPAALPDFDRPDPPTSNPVFHTLLALPVFSWLVTGIWLLYRRRRQRTPSSIVAHP
ncbi:metal-dependent hydrolase [Micromonospora echinofusca]|uniref:DUF2330 domain-containing protein n=1 Tax=Micromonospora echinofusca TaxID=47858 RepID=A0ABS3W1X6_MICEH|nr:metal-dependent hydrolase [Micromonospora echinofusca]MBO4210603.1 hypothetical protein [Micromonospora echinofusca]